MLLNIWNTFIKKIWHNGYLKEAQSGHTVSILGFESQAGAVLYFLAFLMDLDCMLCLIPLFLFVEESCAGDQTREGSDRFELSLESLIIPTQPLWDLSMLNIKSGVSYVTTTKTFWTGNNNK